MKENTVLLSIKDYNELRDIKKAVDERKKIFLHRGFMDNKIIDYILANEKDLENLLIVENDILNKQFNDILTEYSEYRLSVEDVKQMNPWQYLKYWLKKEIKRD